MNKRLFFFSFYLIIIMTTGLLLHISAEITPDQYIFINSRSYVDGETDQPHYIDFPYYSYETSDKTLTSKLELDLTDETKVILGKGISVGPGIGGGAHTYLTLFDNLIEPDLFSIHENGSIDYNNNGEWITLGPGETWTRTFETTSYDGFNGNLIVTETIDNFGAWEKANITHPGATPEPIQNTGDVNEDGTISIVDALLIAQYYVDLDPPGFNPDRADVNCDSDISIIDALLIARYYVGLITEFC
jgi:hypothetical protein